MPMQVKEVAKLARVSVRTLHHYDAIGLLKPSSNSSAGYRLYGVADLEKLQQILFFKEIGFSLQEIKEILNNPGFDRLKALSAHRELLQEKRERMERMLDTVDRTIRSIENGTVLAREELFEGFDMEKIRQHQEKYAEEARRLWGKEAVEESERKVAGYTEQDWMKLQQRIGDINRRIRDGMPLGPSSPQVQEAVADWHVIINGHFYDCSLEVFRGLGNMYVDDERFKAHYDSQRPGMAEFMREAMHLYCDLFDGKH